MHHSLENVFMPIAIFGTLGIIIFQLTKTLTNYYLRKRMIEKGMIGDDAAKILAEDQSSTNRFSSLKWGLIILSAGIGFVIIDPIVDSRDDSTLSFGLFSICVSIGFLVYYFIVKKTNPGN